MQLNHNMHEGITFALTGVDLVATVLDPSAADRVAGGSGFVAASGIVALDLENAWVHQLTLTGDVTDLSLVNAPDANSLAATVRVYFQQDATGGRTVATPAGVQFRDGRSLADLNTAPNAMNVMYLERVSGAWFAFLDNGVLLLDDLAMDFQEAATLRYLCARAQVLDVSNALVNGAGTVAYAKNGAAITSATGFASGDVLSVTAAAGQLVAIPRWL